MTDLDIAKRHLPGHSLCLCRAGEWFTDDSRGISPMMKLIAAGRDLNGYAAADVIIGRAAAMLFIRSGIVAVHGDVMSEGARETLTEHGIPCTFGILTGKIINRRGDGICPMEAAVTGISDPDEGYAALTKQWLAMTGAQKQE